MSVPRLHSMIMVLGLCLLTAAVQAEEWSTNLLYFHGGSYDGWDRYAMTNAGYLGDVYVSLSSGTNQLFDWKTNPALAMLTIVAEKPEGTITNGVTMRVSVPAAWQYCWFDTNSVVSYGGASGKVNPASYSGDGRTLLIPVTAKFETNDTLTVAGLKLADLRLVPADPQRLELEYTGDGAWDASDLYTLQVLVQWAGSSYDGWDCYAMTESKHIWVPKGTVFSFR